MTELRLPTSDGEYIVDSFVDDDPDTEAVAVPNHLDEETITFIRRVQRVADNRVRLAEEMAQRAAAAAQHETAETIAADFEAMAGGRSILMPTGAAAARVRSLAWARRAA